MPMRVGDLRAALNQYGSDDEVMIQSPTGNSMYLPIATAYDESGEVVIIATEKLIEASNELKNDLPRNNVEVEAGGTGDKAGA